MKRVTFVGEADIELTLETDFSDAAVGEPGKVRVQVEGIDLEEDTPRASLVAGWYSPKEAREIARYLTEMADAAEWGQS